MLSEPSTPTTALRLAFAASSGGRAVPGGERGAQRKRKRVGAGSARNSSLPPAALYEGAATDCGVERGGEGGVAEGAVRGAAGGVGVVGACDAMGRGTELGIHYRTASSLATP